MRISDWSSDVCSSDLGTPRSSAHSFRHSRESGNPAHPAKIAPVPIWMPACAGMTKKEPCKSLHPELVEGWGPVRRSSDDVVRVADQVGQGGEIAAQVPPRDQLSLCLVGKIREVDDVLGDQQDRKSTRLNSSH